MSISEALLPEFDQEMANTRKTLERVPDGKFDWKPHEKSGTMGWLAGHVHSVPEWMADIIEKDNMDMAPNGVPMQPPPAPKTRKELLEQFDKHVAKARKALAGASDSHLTKQWSFLNNGQLVFAMPRIACLRTWVMNHVIHHRAQLGMYLRLNNIPVPAIYGPSADEGSM
ncbi:MAG: DinB family protein [Candidatus Acidiferrales bacterium]